MAVLLLSMQRVAIFIDGGYLEKILKYNFKCRTLNFEAFCNKIVKTISPNADILRTYYYNCLPYKSSPPTPQEAQRFAKRQIFYTSLNTISYFEVRLGKLARRKDAQGNIKFEQKLVDVLLSVDLVQLASKGRITDAVIVGGDSDFEPAIQMAKNESTVIWLFHQIGMPQNDLWMIADRRIELNSAFMRGLLK